ncbi:histidine--tRNA ligase [Paenibacillus ginsengarvi]|uniref:Histidine--tRNA ligase n=1 Tax=Paenibacillus ginsengarvi TaxID=400777 RepID=A0A3B0BPA5_9BACL|nr:histidine--tRNA ligase [Paenibacillus ginsengarvi]RKN74178.1 histidine--tRNA ligase [Paenibacillus ginsengarvi]
MQNVKGTSAYRAEEQQLRNKIRSVLERQFALYDFEPVETPILNEQSLLASKYAGGEEILKEMYVLSDQGGRSLGLRYDLTVPFANLVASSPGLPMPYKRYEIGKVFRDGPTKRGRMREFTQCDADVAGVKGPEAEAELMQLAIGVFRALGIEIVIRWNNRRFLGELLGALGVEEGWQLTVMLTLDKLDKIGVEGVMAELLEKRLDKAAAERIATWIGAGAADSLGELADRYGLTGKPGAEEARSLASLLDRIGLGAVCRFDPFLSRGLSFYTGTVYELFVADGSFRSSLGSGGRYDAIIGKLVGSDDFNIPAVGLSFGLDSIMEVWSGKDAAIGQPPVVFIPLGGTMAETLQAAALFRSAGLPAAVDGGARKLKRSIASASARGARFIVIVGEDETANGQIRLKDMRTGEETAGTPEQILLLVEKTNGA